MPTIALYRLLVSHEDNRDARPINGGGRWSRTLSCEKPLATGADTGVRYLPTAKCNANPGIRRERELERVVTSVGVVVSAGCRVKDPRVGLVEDLADKRQVIAAETLGVFPLIAVLVEPAHGDIVARTVLGFVVPDRGTDSSHSNFVNGTGFSLGTLGHHFTFGFESTFLNNTHQRETNSRRYSAESVSGSRF